MYASSIKIIFLFFQILILLSRNVRSSSQGGSKEDVLSVTSALSDKLLEMGDIALSSNHIDEAIEFYKRGIQMLDKVYSPVVTSVSLYTNLGTAYSAAGQNQKALESYRDAILFHSQVIEKQEIPTDMKTRKMVNDIVAQAAFYMGMTYQDLEDAQKAVDAYTYAHELDPLHWSSLANIGSVLQDKMKRYPEALDAYYKAYEILTQTEKEPTDPPEDLHFILSQLQYFIGLCITYAENQKCILPNNKNKEVPCSEMAANAFHLAIELNPGNEAAQHMLAAVTADATFLRASNTYVKQLFEDYAENFEYSLVDELGYNGYQSLRRAFDKAFGGRENVPQFDLVIDAGCGTGLVGQEFRNVSQHLVGVDLSPAILEQAMKARPNLYNETKVGDVIEVFRSMKLISLIIAADSYIYFGELAPLFSSMEEGLADNAFAAFTLENVSHENEKSLNLNKPDWRWQLTPSGRFAHRKDYVKAVGEQYSLETIYYEPMDGFRKEGVMNVRGHIFVMKKRDKNLHRSSNTKVEL